MTVEELIVYGKKYLHSIDAKMLLANILEYDTLNLINHLHEEVEESKIEKYKELIQARLNNKPIQYILGTTNFYGLELTINENVLIPRFETEELVENTKKIIEKKFPKKPNLKILDLCCGSGAIGLAIKNLFKPFDVTMSDISKEALKIASLNSKKLGLETKIIESDLFSQIQDKFDVIISNPPYIKEDEKIESIVKENEPPIALYGGKDGLYYYEKILKDISKYLNKNFLIAFEIGYLQKNDIITIINKYLHNVDILVKKDLSEKDRMIFITNR